MATPPNSFVLGTAAATGLRAAQAHLVSLEGQGGPTTFTMPTSAPAPAVQAQLPRTGTTTVGYPGRSTLAPLRPASAAQGALRMAVGQAPGQPRQVLLLNTSTGTATRQQVIMTHVVNGQDPGRRYYLAAAPQRSQVLMTPGYRASSTFPAPFGTLFLPANTNPQGRRTISIQIARGQAPPTTTAAMAPTIQIQNQVPIRAQPQAQQGRQGQGQLQQGQLFVLQTQNPNPAQSGLSAQSSLSSQGIVGGGPGLSQGRQQVVIVKHLHQQINSQGQDLQQAPRSTVSVKTGLPTPNSSSQTQLQAKVARQPRKTNPKPKGKGQGQAQNQRDQVEITHLPQQPQDPIPMEPAHSTSPAKQVSSPGSSSSASQVNNKSKRGGGKREEKKVSLDIGSLMEMAGITAEDCEYDPTANYGFMQAPDGTILAQDPPTEAQLQARDSALEPQQRTIQMKLSGLALFPSPMEPQTGPEEEASPSLESPAKNKRGGKRGNARKSPVKPRGLSPAMQYPVSVPEGGPSPQTPSTSAAAAKKRTPPAKKSTLPNSSQTEASSSQGEMEEEVSSDVVLVTETPNAMPRTSPRIRSTRQVAVVTPSRAEPESMDSPARRITRAQARGTPPVNASPSPSGPSGTNVRGVAVNASPSGSGTNARGVSQRLKVTTPLGHAHLQQSSGGLVRITAPPTGNAAGNEFLRQQIAYRQQAVAGGGVLVANPSRLNQGSGGYAQRLEAAPPSAGAGIFRFNYTSAVDVEDMEEEEE